jgi:hypothetical protein
LIFVILSDEGDQFTSYSSETFNPNNNVFTQNNYRVYGVIGLDASTGLPGTCSATPTAATNANNTTTRYYDLALATGGSDPTSKLMAYTLPMQKVAKQFFLEVSLH